VKKIENVALVRLSNSCIPSMTAACSPKMEKYPKLKEVIWCQEEPMNQGAWYATHHRLEQCAGKPGQVRRRRAPLVGVAGRRLYSKHAQQQKEVVNAALGIKE
jgi:2-oxoglutarate dehydrogenase E1 component